MIWGRIKARPCPRLPCWSVGRQRNEYTFNLLPEDQARSKVSPRRRTKIVVSLGPSTDRAKTMSALIEQGIDMARLNMSHGTRDDHRRRAQLVRDSAAQHGRAIALLVDLQGPKIRIGGLFQQLLYPSYCVWATMLVQ